MPGFTIHPLKWTLIVVVIGYSIDRFPVSGFEEESDQQLPEQPVGSNRVLPVDAEHQSKISFPRLAPACVKNLKENLVLFLRRVKKRQGRQDDGDDGDDGEEGIAGVLAGLGEGNGALSVLQALPAAVPSLVQGLTQFSSSINQGLNGTDTPNLPSFLVRQGMEAVKFFQAITGAANANRHPDSSHLQSHLPNRKPRPPTPGYEQYPGSPPGGNVETDPDDYPDEEVKQPLQPTLRPRPSYGGNDAGLGLRPDYEPIPGGNPFKDRNPASASNAETINGLPPKTSLWEIYKSFRNKSPGNGTLSEFQLAHPDAFSNELLQSISQSISSIRGQTVNQPVPTDKPSSEIFKQFYPENKNPPKIFTSPNRPTLSVYKPSASTGGIGIDLSNLAINASLNALGGQDKEDEDTTPAPSSIQGDIQDTSILGLGDKEEVEQKQTVNTGTTHNTGTFAQLQQQAQMGVKDNSGGPQFVKSPTSSLLTLQMGEYIPAVSSLHEGDEAIQQVGPQTNHEDHFNGIRNKAPYEAVKDVLIVAPRLTPSPVYTPKPTPGLFLNEAIETTTPTPDFTYEFLASNSRLGPNSNVYPPTASHVRLVDPNAPRPPTLIAAITPNFPSAQNVPPFNQNQKPNSNLEANGVVPSSLLPQVSHVPESQAFPLAESTTTETPYQETEEPEQETTTSEPPPAPVEEDISSPPEPNKKPVTGSGSKTSVLASSLSNFAQLSPINQNEENPNEGQSTESLPSNVGQPSGSQNSKLFQHLLGSLNLPQLLQHPAVLQSLFANQNVNALPNKEPSGPLFITSSPAPALPTETEVDIQEEIVTSTLGALIQEEISSPDEQTSNSQSVQNQNQYQFPSAPYILSGNKGGNPFPSFGAQSNAGDEQFQTQSPSGGNPFSSILQGAGSNAPPAASSSSNSFVNPSFGSQLQQNKIPFQFENLYTSNDTGNNVNREAIPITSTTAVPINQGSFVGNNFFAGLNFAPPSRFPDPGSVGPLAATSTEPPLLLPNQNNWGIQTGNIIKDPYVVPSQSPVTSPPFIANYPAIAAATSVSNSQKEQSDIINFAHFSGPTGFVPDQKEDQESTTSEALFSEPSTTTEKEINLSDLYQSSNGFVPESIPSAPQSGGNNAAPQPTLQTGQVSPALTDHAIFQGTFQTHGYPNYVPVSTSDIHKASYGGSFSSQSEDLEESNYSESPTTTATNVTSDNLSNNSSDNVNATSSTNRLSSSFSDKLASQHIGMSAIAEMSKLPFFQEDSFRPSVLPPYVIGGEKEDDYEQTESETEKSIFQIFTSVTNTSSGDTSTNTNSGTTEKILPSSISTTTIKADSSSTLENDSVEQPYPDFPPGKPVFWMNMYYPNGIPVLMKVTTTSTSTTMKPRRRRRSTTTTEATTSSVPESEYYEDEDDDGKKLKKKKKKVEVDFVS